jgi:hypothetical protein
MSLKTWKRTYLPVPAKNIRTWLGALNHALRKWTGALPTNRARHKVWPEWSNIKLSDGTHSVTVFTSDQCALCLLGGSNCEGCPLYESRGRVRCDIPTDNEKMTNQDAPYSMWCHFGDPHPMIEALKKAKVWYQRPKTHNTVTS